MAHQHTFWSDSIKILGNCGTNITRKVHLELLQETTLRDKPKPLNTYMPLERKLIIPADSGHIQETKAQLGSGIQSPS